MPLYWKNLEMFIFLCNCLSEIIILAKNVKTIETLVYISTKGQADLDLSSNATHIGLPYTYLIIFFSEFTGQFELKFHMEYSADKTI